MALREGINKRNGMVAGVAAAAIVISLVFIAHHLLRGASPAVPYFPQQGFYTTDDGATLFADGIARIPPFDHNGSPAVRAYVFSSDGGKHQWVQYLEKYSDASVRTWEAPSTGLPKASAPSTTGLLVKKPGEREWIREDDAAAGQTLNPQAPEGMGTGVPVAVNP